MNEFLFTFLGGCSPLCVLWILLGSVLNLINRALAHELFNYIRVFGLVMILFTEGRMLSWGMLKKNKTIAMLDTLGLLITALIAGFAFSMLFYTPSIIGFLFGALVLLMIL